MITSWLADRFGAELPVVAATMAGVADGRFAAAAVAAGIVGGIGVGEHTTGEWICEQTAIAARAGGACAVGLQIWALERRPEQWEALLQSAPAMASLSFGDPTPYVARCHDAGIAVVTQVGSTEEARRAEAAGVDAVVARGREGGGHGADLVGTLPLLQSVLAAVRVPVLAAGGIGSAPGLAAVLAAGADGAWVGTAFSTVLESALPDDLVAVLGAAGEVDTHHHRVFDIAQRTGWPAQYGGRSVINDFVRAWSGSEEALQADRVALERFGRDREQRDLRVVPAWTGQGVGLLDARRRPIAEVVAELGGAVGLLQTAAARVRS